MNQPRFDANATAWGLDAHSLAPKNVSQVRSGLSCNCICAGCRAKLVAVHPKKEIRPYFRHHSDQDNIDSACSNPLGARETLVHKLTKQVLFELESFYLPEIFVAVPRYRGHAIPAARILKSREWCLTNCEIEPTRFLQHGIQPDFIGQLKGILAIEVKVTHACDDDKVAKFKSLNWWAVELDVSDLQPEDIGRDPIAKRLGSNSFTKWLSWVNAPGFDLRVDAHLQKHHAEIDGLIAAENARVAAEEEAKQRRDEEARQRRVPEASNRLALFAEKWASGVLKTQPSLYCDEEEERILSVTASELDSQFQAVRSTWGLPLSLYETHSGIMSRNIGKLRSVKVDKIIEEFSLLFAERYARELTPILMSLGWDGLSSDELSSSHLLSEFQPFIVRLLLELVPFPECYFEQAPGD